MAIFDTHRPLATGHHFGGFLSALIANVAGTFATWNDARATRKALERLSDHELDDIGLSRGDLDRLGH